MFQSRLRQAWRYTPAARPDLGELDRLELRWMEDVEPGAVDAESTLHERVPELV